MNWTHFLIESKSIVARYRAQAPDGCDPVNVGIGVGAAIAVASVVGAGATVYAGSQASKSAAAANKANIQNAKDTNAANLEMYYEGRGESGSALLPRFAKDANGNYFEPQMFANAKAVYDASRGLSPVDQIAQYRDFANKYQGAMDSADATASGIFDGSLVNEAMEYQKPVGQARNDAVAARKSAGNEALFQTLGQIAAINNRKGFLSGDSSGNSRLTFNARRDINTAAAADQAQANLENANEIRGIKTQGLLTRLQNLKLPYDMALQKINTSNLPENAAFDQEARRQAVFNGFRLAPGQFTAAQLPSVQPVASLGQNIAQGVGQVAGSLGNLAASKYIADQYGKVGALSTAPNYAGIPDNLKLNPSVGSGVMMVNP